MGLIDDIDLTDKEEGHDPGRPDALSCGVRRSRGHKMGDLRRYHSCREPVRSCRTNVRGVFLVGGPMSTLGSILFSLNG